MKKIVLVELVAIAIVFGTICGIGNHAKKQHEALMQYSNIGTWVVEKGDTLWDIAKYYTDERYDVREVVYEIRQLNKGLNPNLQIGETITVPLYDMVGIE